jgi:hypothetical protein
MNKKTSNLINKQINSSYLNLHKEFWSRTYVEGILDLDGFDVFVKVNCEGNKITKLLNLTNNITYINCKNNYIEFLNNLPNFLETLICDDNKLKKLDNLPETLIFLSCESNELINLDNLPYSLKYLSCGYNPLKNLDNLPNSIIKLYIMEIKTLKSIDNLPNSIEELICSDNLENVSRLNFPLGLKKINNQFGWKK